MVLESLITLPTSSIMKPRTPVAEAARTSKTDLSAIFIRRVPIVSSERLALTISNMTGIVEASRTLPTQEPRGYGIIEDDTAAKIVCRKDTTPIDGPNSGARTSPPSRTHTRINRTTVQTTTAAPRKPHINPSQECESRRSYYGTRPQILVSMRAQEAA